MRNDESIDPREQSETSINLIHAARGDDNEAWHRMNDIYAPLVFRWARRSGLNDWDAADIVQDVFRRVTTHMNRFRKEYKGDSFRGWLWTITQNEIRGWYRARKKAREKAVGGSAAMAMMSEVPEWFPDESSTDGGPRKEASSSQRIQRATQVIRRDFADHTWQAFWRSTVDGHSAAEIARDLGMTKVAVRQAKFRVLSRLREYLLSQREK